MIDLTLIHMSDLHFAGPSSPLTPAEAIEKAREAIARDYPNEKFILAITGDITTKGQVDGYHEASRALKAALRKGCQIDSTLLCPGNHDIGQGASPFAAFNRFAFDVTNDPTQVFVEDSPIAVVRRHGYAFILVNSASHGDHHYGRVPLKRLREALLSTQNSHEIVLLHHSPISSEYGGEALVNAYEFLATVSRAGVSGVLHGHIHSAQTLSIGPKGTFLSGVGSLGFQPEPNMNNQFAIHFLEEGRLVKSMRYTYAADRREFCASEIENS